MPLASLILLFAANAIAGFIDSIAGGGGLITVPALSVILGPGVTAIATNKVAATAASLAALLVYMKNGHVRIRANLNFAAVVGASAWLGSLAAPLFPPSVFKWLLIFACPVITYVVWRKDFWTRETLEHPHAASPYKLLLAGFGCGFYDGIAGPGGGTLMFLSLLLYGRLPVIAALGTAKLANLSSASVSLASYANQGLVNWELGWVAAVAIVVGAIAGAELASRRAAPAARVALIFVSALLLLRLLTM